ncbi:MAG: hypothetical protein JXR77_06535 [Lentisphaeria bacterium]|nr:hypothetical protein [Lentisphaeria bacterium]
MTSLRTEATGWFRLTQFRGRWLFVTPEGHGFFSLGATHAVECMRQDERNLFGTRYGKSEEKLAEFFLARFREWGYNSAGYGSLPTMEKRLPYVATVWTEGPRSFSAGDRSKNADIFDPAVQERLRRRVREVAGHHAESPNCLGYVFIDLPVWSVVPRRGPSYVDFVRGLGPGAPGRKAYVEFLSQRYDGDIDRLAKAYGLDVASVPALLTVDLTAVTRRRAAVAGDDEAFLNRIADTYYACVVGELRARDPHHLVLGDRLMALPEWTPDSVLVTAAKYVDAVAFQPMGTRTMLRSYIDHAAGITGKPVLLADTNTMTVRPQEGQTDTAEYERSAGEHTLAYYLDAAASPACIGIHRCTVRDYRPWDPAFHRRGLLKADDTPYPILVEYTQRTNREVYRLVYAAAGAED